MCNMYWQELLLPTHVMPFTYNIALLISLLVVLLQVCVQVLCSAERSPQLSCSGRLSDCLHWDLQLRGSSSVRVVLQGGAELREGGAGVMVKVPVTVQKYSKTVNVLCMSIMSLQSSYSHKQLRRMVQNYWLMQF